MDKCFGLVFYRPYALPVTWPTASKHCRDWKETLVTYTPYDVICCQPWLALHNGAQENCHIVGSYFRWYFIRVFFIYAAALLLLLLVIMMTTNDTRIRYRASPGTAWYRYWPILGL